MGNSQPEPPSTVPFNDGKNATAVVTGGYRGLGLVTVKHLLSTGGFKGVCLAVRDAEYGAQVKAQLLEEFPEGGDIGIVKCDLSDNKSVSSCASDIHKWLSTLDGKQTPSKGKACYPGLNLLINNAGIMFHENEKAVDGTDLTWSTNVRGPILLTELLLPSLQQATGGARIVNVASGRHYSSQGIRYERIRVNTENYESSFTDSMYNDSKLANVMHAKALAAKLGPLGDGNHVAINACEPGFVATNLFRTNMVANIMSNLIGKSPEQGAQTQLMISLQPHVEHGLYYKDCQVTACNEVVTLEASQKLYEEVLKDVEEFL